MNTWLSVTSSPEAILSLASIASFRPLPWGRSTTTRVPSPSRAMRVPNCSCWPGLSAWDSPAALYARITVSALRTRNRGITSAGVTIGLSAGRPARASAGSASAAATPHTHHGA